jgi:phosphate transport system substrate-binding protein
VAVEDFNKRQLRCLSKLLLALVCIGIGSASVALSEDIVLQGSTTFGTALAQPYAKAVEAQTGMRLEIIPNKSNFGLIALFEGKADLAMISTTLEKEVEFVRRSNPNLRYQDLRAFEVARTRAALVVHPSNPIRSARLEDIRKILTGEISNWRQLGGPDLQIRVVAVRDGGGVVGSVEAKLLGNAHISAPDVIRVQVGTQIVKVVAQEPGAFGITQLAVVKASAAIEMITDEPIEQILSLVSLDDPSPSALATIEAFRRISKQGS